MSKRRFLGLFAIIASLACCSIANAQRYQPFVGLDYFDQDFKAFSPVDVSDFDGGPDPRTGFYASYDRVYVNITRPESFLGTELSSPYQGDWAWGNRYDLGYMTEENHGWSVGIWDIRGPGFVDNIQPIVALEVGAVLPAGDNYSAFPQNRIVRGVRDDGVFGFATDADGNAIPITRNDVFPDDPDDLLYSIRDRRTHSDMFSIELNKTYRVKFAHGVLEPFWGARYMNLTDTQAEDAFEFDALNVLTSGVAYTQRMENMMIGGQLGARYFCQKGRWTLSSEFRFTAAANYMLSQYQLVRTNVDAAGVVLGNPDTAQYNDAFDGFVPMGELRAEAQYHVTRDIALQCGFAVLYFGKGIGRVETAPYDKLNTLVADPYTQKMNLFNTDQDLTAVAFTFGGSWVY